MFTGIVQGVAQVLRLQDQPGLRTITLACPAGFLHGVELGASIACNGVCLTVTGFRGGDGADSATEADFDVMQQSLEVTTLGGLQAGQRLNVERAARQGAEVGGHELSGHIDARATLTEVRQPAGNHALRFEVPAPWMRYLFTRGYVAVNGASLTIAESHRRADDSGWFEVWLIPETLRLTTFGALQTGDAVNLEIERTTQVLVDTVRRTVDERLGPLMPVLQALAAERGLPWP